MCDLEPVIVKCSCGQKYVVYSMFAGDQRKCPDCRKVKKSNHWGTGPFRGKTLKEAPKGETNGSSS